MQPARWWTRARGVPVFIALLIGAGALVARAGAQPGAPAARGEDPAAAAARTLEDCLRRSGADAHDAADLSERCPQLIGALVALGLDRQLDSHWREHLDGRMLAGLESLLRRYRTAPPTPVPPLALLPSALQTLQQAPAPHLSWWQRLRRWLDDLLQSPAQSGNSWLANWLSHLSLPRLIQELLLYLITAGVLLMAGWIVYAELKAAGLLGPRERRQRAAAAQPAPSPPPPGSFALSFEDVERSPTDERCVWLLRLLVQTLQRSGRLLHERALTYRELVTQDVFDDAGQRARFARLALLAERQRYDSLSLGGEQWAAVLSEGRSLYATLSAAVAVRSSPRVAPAEGAAA